MTVPVRIVSKPAWKRRSREPLRTVMASDPLLAEGSLPGASDGSWSSSSPLLGEPFAWHRGPMVFWWVAGVVAGVVLGAAGAAIRKPGPIGLLAALTVPVGVLAQMALMPPGFGLMDNPEAVWARGIVCVGATAAAGIVIARFLRRTGLSAHG